MLPGNAIMRNKIIKAVLIICAGMQLTGCSEGTRPYTPSENAGYSASPTEYAIFLARETSVLTNILFTRIAAAESITKNNGTSQAEIDLAEQALKKIETVQQDLATTMPSQNYMEEYTNMSVLAQSAYSAISSYIECLEKDGNVKDSIEQMKLIYTELAGEANVTYK